MVDIDPRTVAVLKAHRFALVELHLRSAREDGHVLPGNDRGAWRPQRFSKRPPRPSAEQHSTGVVT